MKNVTAFPTVWLAGILLFQTAAAFGQPNPQGRAARPPTQSPASQPRPKSATQQTYTATQVREGEVRFGAQCGFCHGKDAAGGEGYNVTADCHNTNGVVSNVQAVRVQNQ